MRATHLALAALACLALAGCLEPAQPTTATSWWGCYDQVKATGRSCAVTDGPFAGVLVTVSDTR